MMLPRNGIAGWVGQAFMGGAIAGGDGGDVDVLAILRFVAYVIGAIIAFWSGKKSAEKKDGK